MSLDKSPAASSDPFGHLTPFYPPATSAAIAVSADLHSRRVERRRFINLERASNARRQIASLPAPGESLHGWMTGHWDAWLIVPVMLELIAPATIRELNIATLGFNVDNTRSLLGLLDAGNVGHVTFLCSHFWRSHEGDVVKMLEHEITSRGGRFAATRCHAKIILAETTDDRWLVWESSANLRSCRNAEQFAIHNDRELLLYHRAQMMRLLDAAQ